MTGRNELSEIELKRINSDLDILCAEHVKIRKRMVTMFTRKSLEGDAYYSEDEFNAITELLNKNTEKLDQITVKLNTHQIPTPVKNKWLALLIKHDVLGARRDFNLSGGRGYASAGKKLEAALKTIQCGIQTFKFSEDAVLQEETHFTLLSMSAINKNIDDLIIQFCEKSTPTSGSLSLLEDLMRKPTTGDPFKTVATSARRQLFWTMHKTFQEQLESKLEGDESNLECALEYTIGNLSAYKFSMYTYIYRVFKIQQLTYNDLNHVRTTHHANDQMLYKFAAYNNRMLHEYIYPSLRALAKTSANNLRWSLQLFTLVKEINTKFTNVHRGFAAIFSVWAEQNKTTKCPLGDPFLRLAQITHIEIINEITDILSHPELTNVFSSLLANKEPTTLALKITDAYQANLEMVKERDKLLFAKGIIIDSICKEIHATKQENEQTTQALIAWEQTREQHATKYIRKKVAVKMKKKQLAKKTQAADIEIEEESKPDESLVETTNVHLLKAFQDMKGKRFKPSIKAFRLAYQEAVRTHNLSEQLDALDGELFLLSGNLLQKLEEMSHILYMRKKRSTPLTPAQRNKFFILIKEGMADCKILPDSFSMFFVLAQSPVTASLITADLKRKAGMEYTLHNIPNLIIEVKNKLNYLKLQYQELQKLFEINQDLKIFKLGLRLLPESKNDEEIYNAGYKEYQRIGKEKRANGLDVSLFTQERHFFRNMAPLFDSLCTVGIPQPVVEVQTVAFSPVIQELFSEILAISPVCFLVGSRAISAVVQAWQLPRSLTPNKKTDIDIIIPKEYEQNLIAANIGFKHSGFQASLYVRKTKHIPVDCRLVDMQLENWMLVDISKLDFTINIYIDHQGLIYDPSGEGLKHIYDGILKTIYEPSVHIQHDPFIVLRAIRYILAGFKPVPELTQAIQSFVGFEEKDMQHVFAIIHKHLSELDNFAYVQLLHDFGLLTKIFGIKLDDKKIDDTTLWRIKKTVGYIPDYKPEKPFFQSAKMEENKEDEVLDPTIGFVK